MISAACDLKLESLLLRGAEVAQLIGCSRAMAYRLMQRGVIPTVRMPGGKIVRVPRQALIEWVRANTRGAAGLSPLSANHRLLGPHLLNEEAERIPIDRTINLAGRAGS